MYAFIHVWCLKWRRSPQSKSILSVCRCNGYVYTYRLHKDDSGSWAADVRLFLSFVLKRYSLCNLKQDEQNLFALVGVSLVCSVGCFGANPIRQAISLRQTVLKNWRISFPFAITTCQIVPPSQLKLKMQQHTLQNSQSVLHFYPVTCEMKLTKLYMIYHDFWNVFAQFH